VAFYLPERTKTWCESHGAPYRSFIPAHFGFSYGPNYEVPASLGPTTEVEFPEGYVAEIPNCYVVGGYEAVLTSDDRALMDSLYRAHAERFYIPTPPWGPARADLAAVHTGDTEVPWIIPEGILLQGWYGPSYYHWMIEHLSKFLLLEKAGIPPRVPLLVDERVAAGHQYMEMLASIDRDHRPIIPLHPGWKYRVDHLVVPGSICLPPTVRGHLSLEPGDAIISKEAVSFLRSRLGSGECGARRIYLDRVADKQTNTDRLTNKISVAKVFKSLGFEIVSPERMSFADQRALFSDVAVVASQTGAGLVGMLLAPPSSLMICMQACKWSVNPYSDIATLGGQPSLFITGDGKDPLDQMSHFSMDTDELRSTLEEVLS
jgi:capsular polysaccharide biosynthesis protein